MEDCQISPLVKYHQNQTLLICLQSVYLSILEVVPTTIHRTML